MTQTLSGADFQVTVPVTVTVSSVGLRVWWNGVLELAYEVTYTWRGRRAVTAAMPLTEACRPACELRGRAMRGEPIGDVTVYPCGSDCPRCGARSWGQTPDGLAECTRCFFTAGA